MKIVLPDYIDLSQQHKSQLKRLGAVTIYDDLPEEEAEIISRIQGAELITASWIYITENIIKKTPSLKYIVLPAVGYDHVDTKAATKSEIKVINCPTHNSLSVAEYTIALILAVTRRISEANTALRNRDWNSDKYKGTELKGKMLTLIGYGNSARQVATLVQGFGMKVSYANSKTLPNHLDELIATADIVSLHLPFTQASKHLIDERRLNLLKNTAYLINTARGAIIDQKALLKVLKAGRIAGAALDVFEDEPVGSTPTEEIMQLVKLDNVVATPHIAYNTEEMVMRLGEELIANIQACIADKPINVVN
jgi:D-3-phosphoglycerate dehydrogenase